MTCLEVGGFCHFTDPFLGFLKYMKTQRMIPSKVKSVLRNSARLFQRQWCGRHADRGQTSRRLRFLFPTSKSRSPILPLALVVEELVEMTSV